MFYALISDALPLLDVRFFRNLMILSELKL
jgi:hypothetical protein